MHIVVNTRLLIKNKLEGIGWFTYQTLKIITRARREVKFTFLFDRPFDPEHIFSDNVTGVVLGPKARHPFLYIYWMQFRVKPYIERTKPDLFLSPDGFLCLNTNIKQLPVIHDINFFHYPQHIKFLTEKYYNSYFPRFARVASRIATVSVFSKNDIAKCYRINESKIDVVYNGINSFFRQLNQDEKEKFKEKYAAGCNYFVYVGAISPRKNISNLLLAFDSFKQNYHDAKVALVIAGAMAWGNAEVQSTLKSIKYSKDVYFTGRLSDEELAGVLGSAEALVYVPLFEGFGIPVVEAMEANVPIICSNVTSLPEVAGDAAILIDPTKPDVIANAMAQIVSSEETKLRLLKNATTQKLKFSWEKSASLLWDSIIKAISSN